MSEAEKVTTRIIMHYHQYFVDVENRGFRWPDMFL
jgi:hypothetical protein